MESGKGNTFSLIQEMTAATSFVAITKKLCMIIWSGTVVILSGVFVTWTIWLWGRTVKLLEWMTLERRWQLKAIWGRELWETIIKDLSATMKKSYSIVYVQWYPNHNVEPHFVAAVNVHVGDQTGHRSSTINEELFLWIYYSKYHTVCWRGKLLLQC